MPINQVSMQFNSIIMALAGAERVFKLLDEEPETDEGYVMLVNCEYDENGAIVETDKHTGHWAWACSRIVRTFVRYSRRCLRS